MFESIVVATASFGTTTTVAVATTTTNTKEESYVLGCDPSTTCYA